MDDDDNDNVDDSAIADKDDEKCHHHHVPKKKQQQPKKRSGGLLLKESTNNNRDNNYHHHHRVVVKRVTFSDVSIRYYNRCWGVDVVPEHGSWPLGMELQYYHQATATTAVMSRTCSSHNHHNHLQEEEKSMQQQKEEVLMKLSVEIYESRKQERLNERWQRLLIEEKSNKKKTKKNQRILTLLTKRPPEIINLETTTSDIVLETRQWDYRNEFDNPLFRKLNEHDRRDLLLLGGQTTSTTISTKSPPPPSQPKKRHNARSNRSTLMADECLEEEEGEHPPEVFHDTYGEAVSIQKFQKELEQLRDHRTIKEGSMGCNCRTVLSLDDILSKGGGHYDDSKKRNSISPRRRWKLQDIIHELANRNISYNPKASQKELEQLLLYQVVVQEGNNESELSSCCGLNCSCVQNDIECQEDTCSCCHHHRQGHSSSSSSSSFQRQRNNDSNNNNQETFLQVSEERKLRCGNPNGTNVFDASATDMIRKRLLLTMCQPVGVDVQNRPK